MISKIDKVRLFLRFWDEEHNELWQYAWGKFTSRQADMAGAEQILIEIMAGVEDCDWTILNSIGG